MVTSGSPSDRNLASASPIIGKSSRPSGAEKGGDILSEDRKGGEGKHDED